MKTVLTIWFVILFQFAAKAQNISIDEQSGKYQIQAVEITDSLLTKEALFLRVKEWIALNYKSADKVIQYEDVIAGKIIGKGVFKTYMFLKDGILNHTFIFEFKDGRFRYTYTDFSYSSAGSGTLALEGAIIGKKKILSEIETKVTSSINGIKLYIIGHNTSAKDDW